MKRYRYIKSNAFTTGASLGNPAACVFMGEETLSPEQMQAVAREHKGFVMEVVFCSQSDVADCKLTYYSSECEVDFCGHGTIATMYSMIKDNAALRSKLVVKVETNRKGIVEVFNAIDTEDAVYITAPDPIDPSRPSHPDYRCGTAHSDSADNRFRNRDLRIPRRTGTEDFLRGERH